MSTSPIVPFLASPRDDNPRGLDLDSLPPIWTLNVRVEWLVQGLLPLGSVTLLSAASGTGKTWLAHGLAGAVAHGTPFLGRSVQARRVVYFDGENPAAVVKNRIESLGIAQTSDLGIWGGWLDEPPPRPDDERVVAFARRFQPLMIWDPLVRFHDGDEQSSTETRAFMTKFRDLANLGATVVVLHHTGKTKGSKQYRGSSDIPASVDMAYKLEGSPRNGELHRLTLENFKSRFAASPDKIEMEFRAGEGFVPIDAPRDSVASVVEGIVSAEPGLNGGQIVERALGRAGKNPIYEYLKNRASRRGLGRAKLFYPLAAESEAA
jgi:hypothetical protein